MDAVEEQLTASGELAGFLQMAPGRLPLRRDGRRRRPRPGAAGLGRARAAARCARGPGTGPPRTGDGRRDPGLDLRGSSSSRSAPGPRGPRRSPVPSAARSRTTWTADAPAASETARRRAVSGACSSSVSSARSTPSTAPGGWRSGRGRAASSREARLDAARRLDVVRRQHAAIVARTDASLRASREALAGQPRAVVVHRNDWFSRRARRGAPRARLPPARAARQRCRRRRAPSSPTSPSSWSSRTLSP